MASTMSMLALLATIAVAKNCQNITIPISISSRNAVFDNIATPQTPLDPTTFALNQTRQGHNFTNEALTGYATVSGNYNISAQFCSPEGYQANLKDQTIQILTHGIGFDKTYWDLAYNNFNYSYVDTAVDMYGYSTLAIDRLGIGLSSHGEPKNEIQSFLEVQALGAVTRIVRNGALPNINKKFSKIVHVGHSFGSAQTYALTALYPTISDGIILTGFSTNGSSVNLFSSGNDFQQANLNQPLRFGSKQNTAVVNAFVEAYALTDIIAPIDVTTVQGLNYPNGYLANSNVNALQYLFLLPGYFDIPIAYYGESGKQPVTIGELLTLGSVPATSTFAGPVLVITGSGDLPYCGGDCLRTGSALPSIPASAVSSFPNASKFQAYIQPNTGHGINFHYNATASYVVMQNFLQMQGLESHN